MKNTPYLPVIITAYDNYRRLSIEYGMFVSRLMKGLLKQFKDVTELFPFKCSVGERHCSIVWGNT